MPFVNPEQRRASLVARSARLRKAVPDATFRKFEIAATSVDVYLDALRLSDLGPLAGSPLSPNVLRSVRMNDGTPAVLKLVGDARTGEAATLMAWKDAGVPCAPLLDHAFGRFAPSVTHLLLGWLDGSPLTHHSMPSATAQVCEVFARAHIQPPGGVIPLAMMLAPHLEASQEAWRAAGLDFPVSVLGVFEDLRESLCLLHGDAVGMNLLCDGARVHLIDPAGVYGPPEFDAGRWIVRCLAVSEPSRLRALAETALSTDRTLREDVLELCIGAELVVEVYRRLTSPDMFFGLGSRRETFGVHTLEMAAAAMERLA